MLNKLLHHVGMSWIIETREKLKYDIYEHNQYRVTCGPWYSTYISKKLHGIVFEEFIRNAITDRYNLMCSIDVHEKNEPSCFDDGCSGGGNALPSNSITEVLFTLRESINFIDCWL